MWRNDLDSHGKISVREIAFGGNNSGLGLLTEYIPYTTIQPNNLYGECPMFTMLKIVLITALLQGIQLGPPSEYTPIPPVAGDTAIRGKALPYCANNPISVYAGTEKLGQSIVSQDGTYTVSLSRPLRAGEKLLIITQCGAYPSDIAYFSVKSPPPPVPEPATVTLVGSGLAALGLRVLRSRRQ